MRNACAVLLCLLAAPSYAQMIVTVDSNATSLAQTIAGAGVSVSNAVLTCTGRAAGTFHAIPQTLPIESGVVLTTGKATDVLPPNNSPQTSVINQVGADSDLNAFAAFSFAGNYDACALEFDMYVTGDSVSFDYVFGSEEYNEWVWSQYNDVFGFFISGPGINGPYSNNSENIALVPGTNDRVSINTINCDSNSQYYICNNLFSPYSSIYGQPCDPGLCPADSFPWLLEYDGYTALLQAKAAVQPCNTYHLKLAIQDNSDPFLDAGVFVRRSSINSAEAVITAEADYNDQVFGDATAVEGCINGRFRIELSDAQTTPTTIAFNVTGTADQGADYDPIPTSVTFQPGETVQYMDINVIADGIPDPNETVILYQLSPCNGTPMDSTVLYITDNFTAQATADTGVCLGSPVFLSVNGGNFIDYQWSPSTYLTCDTCQYPFTTPLANITYTVVISSPGGCTATDSVVVNVNPDMSFAGNDTMTCGYTMQLNGSVPLTAQGHWIQAGSSTGGTSVFDDSTAASTSVTVSQSGTYMFAWNVSNGCTQSDTVVVNFTNPELSVSPADTGVCPGSCVTLNAESYGDTYTAYPNLAVPGDPFSNVHSKLKVTGHCTQTIQPGIVQSVTVSVNDSTLEGYELTLVSPDNHQVQLVNYNMLSGANLVNTVFSPSGVAGVSTGTAPYTGTFLPYQSFNFLNGSPVNGTWQLIAQDVYTGDTGILVSWSITFNTSAYAWSPSAGLSATNVSNPQACPTVSTTYTAVVTGDCGCADTATAIVNTSGGLLATLTTADAACNQLNGSVTATVGSGTPPYTYAWSDGATTPAIENVAAGVYAVTVADASGCNAVLTDTVNASDGPTVTASVTDAICNAENGSIDLIVTGGAAPYAFTWSNNGTDQSLTNVAANTYSVTVSDAGGCSVVQSFDVISTGSIALANTATNADCNASNGSVDLTVTGGTLPYGFSWSNGVTTEDLSDVAAASYSVTVNDANGCSAADTITVNNANGPVVSFTTVNPGCSGAGGSVDVAVNGGTSPYNFTWSNGVSVENLSDVGSGAYSVTVSDANGCSASADVSLSSQMAPVLTLNGLVDSLCEGQSFAVTASGFAQYAWNPATGLSAAEGDDVTVTALNDQTYSVVGSNADGCADTAVFNVTVVPAAVVSFADTFAGCAPLNVNLQAVALNASGVQWWIDGHLESTQNPVSVMLGEGTHNALVVALSPQGCNDTLTLNGFANVYAAPVAGFDPTTTGANAYTFTNQSTGATTYQWNFGDDAGDTIVDAQHVYPDYGSYLVVLTAANGEGCIDTAQHLVTVQVPHAVFIPNTFTPNGDGANDLFGVYGTGIRQYRLEVYDRWGEHVYSGEGTNPTWNGTFKGKAMNASTFVYIANVEYLDGFRQQFSGDVNVLR